MSHRYFDVAKIPSNIFFDDDVPCSAEFWRTEISWIDWPSTKSNSNNFHRSTIQVANHAHSQVKQVHSILLLFHDLQLTGELDIQVSLIFDVGCHSLLSLVSSGNHTPGGVANCKGNTPFRILPQVVLTPHGYSADSCCTYYLIPTVSPV